MRRRRDRSVPVSSFLTPINIRDFGGEDDPCFGKEYDMTTPECQSCGDQEMCAIAFLGKVKQKRLEYEKANPVKDLEISDLEFKKAIKDFVESGIDRGNPQTAVLKTASRKFKVNQEYINKIISNNGHSGS